MGTKETKYMKRFIGWVRRNPKLALVMTAIGLMPTAFFLNYLLLIFGVITAEEFATITGALFPFLKGFLLF